MKGCERGAFFRGSPCGGVASKSDYNSGNCLLIYQGCQRDCTQPLNRDIWIADNKLETFLTNTGGYSHVQQKHTWKGKDCQAALVICLFVIGRSY